MSSQQQLDAAEEGTWREDDGTGTTATEATPLLRSEATSRPGSSRSSIPDGPGDPAAAKPSDDSPSQHVSVRRAVAICLSVYLLIFLQACNMSGMAMAQSRIAEDLDAYEEAMWMTTVFLVAFSSGAPIAGRLSSIFSPRLLVVASSVFMAIGGLVTSVAPSFPIFLVGRAISGIGGSAVMVVPFILVLEFVSKKRRGLFIGLINCGFTTGISLGAVVFGALISTTGWRFLFGMQVPAAMVAGLGTFFTIPSSFTSSESKKSEGLSLSTKLRNIDYLGAFLLTLTIVLFLFGLSGTVQWIPLVVSAGTLAAFVGVEMHVAADPIVPLSVLLNRGALLSCFAQLGFMASRWTVLFYAPITALAVRGFTPAASGSMLIPTNLGFGLGGLIVGWLHVKRAGSFYTACLVSIVLFGLSLFTLAYASSPDVPFPLYILDIFLNGLFTGATLNYTLAHLLHLTPPDTHYVSTSLMGTFRGFAGSFGTAIGGGIFMRTLRGSLEDGFRLIDGEPLSEARETLIRRLIGGPALVFHGSPGLTGPEQVVAVHGYVDALQVMFKAASVLTLFVLLLQAGTGWRAPTPPGYKAVGDEEDIREQIFREVVEHDGERDLEV